MGDQEVTGSDQQALHSQRNHEESRNLKQVTQAAAFHTNNASESR